VFPFTPRLAFVLAAFLAAAVSFAGIGSHSLWTPDEPTGAAVGKAMLASGDLVVPRLNGRPFLEKPPLYWWVQVAAFRLCGVSDAAARVPSALFATLTLLVTFALGRRLGGARVGVLAAGILAATAEFNEDMGKVVVDPALVFFVAVCHFGFAVFAAPRSRREAWLAMLLIAAALPGAFLAKGVVGPALGAGPPVLYLLAAERGRAVRRLLPAAALTLPLFAAAVLPWALALVHAAGWSSLRECLVGNTVGRFAVTAATRVYGHRQPFWYYVVPGAASLLPWVLALPAMLRAGVWRAGGGSDRGEAPGDAGEAGHARQRQEVKRLASDQAATLQDQAATAGENRTAASRTAATGKDRTAAAAGQAATVRRLLLATFGLGVLLLSIASTKRGLYLLPLLPAFAVCVAWWAAGAQAPGGEWKTADAPPPLERPWDRPTQLALLGLAGLVTAVLAIAAALLRWGPRLGPRIDPLRAALSPSGLAACALATAAAGALLLARLVRHLAQRTTPRPAGLAAAYLLLFLAWQTAGKALVDPLKNLHDMTAALARLDPGAAAVAAYRPSESVLAIVNFDLGREVAPLAGPQDLAAYLARRPEGKVLIAIDAARRLPPALRSRLRLIYDETGRKASPFGIAAGDRQAGR
jgi:hypothetical protein